MTDEDKIRIGKKLRDLRGERSIAEVAAQMGIGASALSNYENGLRIPIDEVKIIIARFYKKSVQQIFFDSELHGKQC